MRGGQILLAARIVHAAVAGLGEAAQAGIHPDGGLTTRALAHLAEGGADEIGGEAAIGLVRRHGEQQELPHAGRQVLFELGQQRGQCVARIARQARQRLFTGDAVDQEQGLDQLALAKADLGHHVPKGRRGAQSLQSFHC